jgi:hypothetical protein
VQARTIGELSKRSGGGFHEALLIPGIQQRTGSGGLKLSRSNWITS